MPKFSDEFLRSINNSMLTQSVQGVAYKAGAAPGVIKRREEQERKDKGILGGTLAAQQMASQGMFTPEATHAFADKMYQFGVDPNQILQQTAQLRELSAQASQQNKTENFVNSLGEEYQAQFNAGFSLKEVHSAYLKNAQQDSIVSLAQELDPTLSAELAAQMTSKDLMELYESRKEKGGVQAWTSWIESNSEINNSNRQEAIAAAVAAFGAEAPKKVADLEAKQLDIRAKREGKKSMSVIITMKQDAALFEVPGMGGSGSKIQARNLPVGDDGQLTQEAKDWLQAHATTAIVSDTNETWSPDPEPPPPPPPGEGTLGQLAPGLVDSLVNAEMKE